MNKFIRILAAAGAFASLTLLHAVTYVYNPGVVHETDAFADFNTTGAEMAGMGIHVRFSDGTSYDGTWQTMGATSGGLTGAGIPVHLVAGGTGSSAFSWLLFNPTSTLWISSVSLDGQPGNTVFDVGFPFGQFAGFNFVGTAGTSGGSELQLGSLYGIYEGMTVTFSDAVALAGADPVGDVFRRLTIDFAPDRMLAPQALLEFRQDTDTIAFGSVLKPVEPTAVPEGGATASMIGAGLVGLLAYRRRRVVPI
ncbi:MAG TPA: hypothetical protein VHN79_02440 [Lacunisphaera sp.]|nr:hypothetical protein [Lacunisphaera sp.]